MIVRCWSVPLYNYYADGLERIELFVQGDHVRYLAPLEPGIRCPVALVAHGQRYQAGLRAQPGDGRPYLCPDLRAPDNRRTSLARLLVDLGSPKAVDFDVVGTTWTVVGVLPQEGE